MNVRVTRDAFYLAGVQMALSDLATDVASGKTWVSSLNALIGSGG